MKFQFILFSLSVLVVLGCKHRNENTVIPSDWFSGAETLPTRSKALEGSVDNLLNVYSKNLTGLEEPGQKWQLAGSVFDLGISLEGAMGALVGEGEAAVNVIWLRKDLSDYQLAATAARSNNVVTDRPVIELMNADSEVKLDAKAQSMLKLAKSAGFGGNESVLKDKIKNSLIRFSQLGNLMDISAPESEEKWRLQEFRQVLGISAMGEVGSGIEVGGLVQFELHWKVEHAEHDKTKLLSVSDVARSKSLTQLLQVLVSDLNLGMKQVQDIEESEFELEKFYVELGLKGEREIGIAEGSASAIGKLVFAKAEEEEEHHSLTADRSGLGSEIDYVPVIGAAESQREVLSGRLSEENSVTRANEAASKKLFKASRKRFQQGLKRALVMGKFFAKRAQAQQQSNWVIHEIESEFEITVAGTVGIATVEGSAAISLEFEREH